MEEKFNKEDGKEVSNTEQELNKNNTLIAERMDHQNVKELEENDKKDGILEGFFFDCGFC